jgi:hypothetical protein
MGLVSLAWSSALSESPMESGQTLSVKAPARMGAHGPRQSFEPRLQWKKVIAAIDNMLEFVNPPKK